MKACEVREANIIWAAAALITVSCKAICGVVAVTKDEEDWEIVGFTGPVVRGGADTIFGRSLPPQQVAR